MSVAHVIYIPLCLSVGLVLGWVLGARGARDRITHLESENERLELAAAKQRLAD